LAHEAASVTWWAVDVEAAPERREAVGAWLVAHTGQAIEEREDGTLVTFAADELRAEELMQALAHEHGARATRRALDPVDWTVKWRDGIEARHFGRLTVTPSWIPAPRDGITVTIDPESAFGSGEHGSTRAALTLLERHLRPGDRVLDLGSGSGILAIAAVKLGASRATGIEIDDDANEVALVNARRNGVANAVEFLTGDAADLAPLLGPADLLLSNILRTVNTALLPAIAAALPAGALAVFSGMETPEGPLFRPELDKAGFVPVEEATDAGWWAIAARRA
jgi:ribosomal protein L11 methyltransferase